MNKILIVEDDQQIRDELIRVSKKINSKVEVLSTGYAKEALEIATNNKISAFFLDIQLIDYSGLELAKQIRSLKDYSFTPIVFITAIPTRELEAFKKTYCYDYIIKPFTYDEIEKVFKRILIDYIEGAKDEGDNDSKLPLKFKGYTQLINLKDIVYVEYSNRKILIHTKKESIKYLSMPLKKFKLQLSNDFIQVHQSMIINKLYISKIDLSNRNIKLTGSDNEIPIGRSFTKEVGEYLNEIY